MAQSEDAAGDTRLINTRDSAIAFDDTVIGLSGSDIGSGDKVIHFGDKDLRRRAHVAQANDETLPTDGINHHRKRQMLKDHPTRTKFEKIAKATLRNQLREHELSYERLAVLLRDRGVHVTARSLTIQVSKGGFSAAFLLLCLDAMGVTMRLDREG